VYVAPPPGVEGAPVGAAHPPAASSDRGAHPGTDPDDRRRDEAGRPSTATAVVERSPPTPPRERGQPRSHGGPRRWGRVVALAVVAAVLLALAWFANALFQPFKGEGDGGAVRVSVPQGAGLGEIADLLEQNGVISSSGLFQLRVRLAGASGELRPGSYELREDMSFTAALDALEEGVPPNVVVVSIPEGRSRREIAPLVKKLEGNYMRATRRSPALDPREYKARRATSLEGFLFPATYELKKGQPVKRLVEEQLTAFKRNFSKVDLSFARRKNLTPYDVLIIASLIEREAAVPRERAIISSVIYNRLKNDIGLGIDATVRFITGNWTEPLKQSELANPSPYNTRIHSGLPPGPIGNPGLASIKAAARPARTKYLFYVAAVCGNGRHRFAETDAEFQRYVAEYNRARDERGGKSPTQC
ncbi:MAG TPA: endolytic transglycosylase MltG, partial [Thermoleophilaceae bacterium]|nr:endolytic transglycosylase MltG [Thermoleophilaceae bacterium]